MTYDKLDRLSTYNSQGPTFDLDGNMTACVLSGNTVDFTYDSGNRLIQAGSTTYAYDANNNRISSTTSEQKTQYAYENVAARLSQLLIRNVSDGSKTFYVYGNGLIGHQDSTGYSVYHFGFRESTIALTNSQGTVTDRFTYGAYGELLFHTGSSDTPFKYNGRDGVATDADGLYYMRMRYYSPELKRFVNEDTLKGSVQSSNMLNRYTFAIGNPVSNIDPRGLSSEAGVDAVKIATEIGEGVATAASVAKEFQTDNYVWEKRLELLKSSDAFKSLLYTLNCEVLLYAHAQMW